VNLSQYSVWLRAGRPGDRSSIPGRGERIFSLASVSTQPPVQWVPGVLSPGLKRGRGVTLANHPHLVPRSRMSTSYTSYPPPSASVACSGTVLAKFYKLKWNSMHLPLIFRHMTVCDDLLRLKAVKLISLSFRSYGE
jgi:hypothetical protein